MPSDAVVSSESPFEQRTYVNFYRIIKSYISPFFKPEPQAALQYAYLVALNSDLADGVGERQKQLALGLVRDIVLASRQWTKLLGSLRPDGTKEVSRKSMQSSYELTYSQVGIIERSLPLVGLNNTEEYIRAIVLSAAEQSGVDASLVDSIELFHLAGATDKVVEAVTRALAHSLSQNPGGAGGGGLVTERRLGLNGAFGGTEDAYDLAQRVMRVYAHEGRRNVDGRAWEVLEVLSRLKKGLKEFEADRPDLALEVSLAMWFGGCGMVLLARDERDVARESGREEVKCTRVTGHKAVDGREMRLPLSRGVALKQSTLCAP